MKKWFNKYLALIILVISTIVIGLMYWRLENTSDEMAVELLQEPLDLSKQKLDSYFKPIVKDMKVNRERLQSSFVDTLNIEDQIHFFIPTISYYEQISSMGLAHSGGYELDILPTENNEWQTRLVYVDKTGYVEYWRTWQVAKDSIHSIEKHTSFLKTDPRERPWFTGVMALENESGIFWTEPYIYNTTQEVGMTASTRWNKGNKTYILAYDLTLNDLSKFTSNYDVSQNGFLFIMDENLDMIGLPNHRNIEGKDLKGYLLLPPEELNVPLLKESFNAWEDNELVAKAFNFESSEGSVWVRIIPYEISKGQYIYLGVVVPEKDLIAGLNRTKKILLIGYVVIILLTLLIAYNNRQVARKNKILATKNSEIEEQKHIIEEKNKDITDSINYSLKIQQALLSTRKSLLENAPSSTLFFGPKDVVSGDFYFYEKIGKRHVFCVADCTGHGVPGALMSVLGVTYFQKYLIDLQITPLGSVLDHVREDIIAALTIDDKIESDGMDVAIIEYDRGKMYCAGAQNPVYFLRKRENVGDDFTLLADHLDGTSEKIESNVFNDHYVLFPIKSDKQPVGNFIQAAPFKTKSIDLMEGDQAFIFTDGYADQFGGPKGKKFRYKPFKKLVLSLAKLDAKNKNAQLASFFEEWKGNFDQIDDVCVMGIHFDDLNETA